MAYIHEILGKANIRSVADFLLFGLGPDEDTRNYEERIDELYDKFEDAVKKYDPNPTSELLDLSMIQIPRQNFWIFPMRSAVRRPAYIQK